MHEKCIKLLILGCGWCQAISIKSNCQIRVFPLGFRIFQTFGRYCISESGGVRIYIPGECNILFHCDFELIMCCIFNSPYQTICMPYFRCYKWTLYPMKCKGQQCQNCRKPMKYTNTVFPISQCFSDFIHQSNYSQRVEFTSENPIDILIKAAHKHVTYETIIH